MQQLSKLQSALFALGAVLMLVGALAFMKWPAAATAVYAAGALAFASVQLQQRYLGSSFTLQRLRRMVVISDVLFMGVALMMLADRGNPLGLDHYTWLAYVHRRWVVVLLLAAVLQLYAVLRMDAELQKEAKKR